MSENQIFISIMSESEANDIQKLLLEKLDSESISEKWISEEFELIKNGKETSIIFQTVRDFYNLSLKRNITHLSVGFIKLKYKNVIRTRSRHKKYVTPRFINIPYDKITLSVPEKIGHGYMPIKALPIEQLSTKLSAHKRLRVFYHKGLNCVSCDKIGEYLIVGRDVGGGMHIDLYTKDFDLMTIDHIRPKSKGGSDEIENLDPMCSICNSQKANNFEEEIEESI